MERARRRLLPVLATAAGAGLIALLVYGVTAQSASRTLDQQVREGHRPPAPGAERALPRLGARGTTRLAALRGRVVVLNFWASWCEPCQFEAPLLERAQRQLERRGGTVLGVTYEDLSSDAEAFARRYGITYPNVRDTTGEFAHAYGTNELPESFILDRRGDVVAIERGEIGQRFLDRALSLARQT